MEPQWSVTPSVCVSRFLDELCEMNIELVFNNLPPKHYCLYQDEVMLNCWLLSNEKRKIQLSYSHPVWLRLKDSEDTLVLQQQLTIKAQQANKKRSRVRSPWSLF